MSRLAPFIYEHSDEILDAWEKFAKELPNAEAMDVAALRDHVQGMLDAIAADLGRPESDEQRDQKSRGQRDRGPDEAPTAASKHDDRGDRRHLGLGLYFVDRIVEAHGGQIEVRSSHEHGTTFRVTIPRHAASEPKPAAREQPTPQRRSA